MLNFKLTDDDEQHAKCLLVKDRMPCMFRVILQKLGWIVDTKCPVRTKATKAVEKYFADKERDKYEKEHPDG